MYLFTRSGRFTSGSVREAMAFVAEITEKVHRETGLDVQAWAATLSPELGTTTWATFVESLEELEAAEDKLAVSDAFVDLVEKGAKLFDGPLTDRLATVVHGAPDPGAPRPSYVSVARAEAANGSVGAAIAGGVEIAEAATRITGVPTMFLVDVTGPYGGCRWTSGFADIGSLERGEAALMADESWLELIDRVSPAYAQGATQSIYRRVT
jgi:hypothetical protein